LARNGRLSTSVLAPIPGGNLRRDCANAWNAMNAESVRRFNTALRPLGPDSSYRTLDRQVYWRNWWCSRGKCSNAAVPGTSNHGLGIAVDVASRRTRWIIDQIGRKYGWSKAWSDAPNEWWHLRWRPGRYAAVDEWKRHTRPTLRYGDRGHDVRYLQYRLRAHGHTRAPAKGKPGRGKFGRSTRVATIRFQRRFRLPPDGVVGPRTWSALNQRPKPKKKK
jgi:hypothetical protein